MSALECVCRDWCRMQKWPQTMEAGLLSGHHPSCRHYMSDKEYERSLEGKHEPDPDRDWDERGRTCR